MKAKNNPDRSIKKVIVFAGSGQQRLDVFVASQIKNVSRKKIQSAILDGKIRLNDLPAKPRDQIKDQDRIKIDLKLPEVIMEIEPQGELQIPIVSQNEDFLVINKPCGISVHPSENERKNTVVNWAIAHFPETKNVGEDASRPGIVHRLDKATSGIMIIALNQESYSLFKHLFKDRQIQKTYFALCWGILPKESGEIKTHIGRSKAKPNKQATSANPAKLINPKKARTKYRVMEKGKGSCLVKVDPRTGRKHQIRIHFQSIGHPLVGDKKYFTKKYEQKSATYRRLMLHASKISFEYLDGKNYEFSCPLPEEFSILP